MKQRITLRQLRALLRPETGLVALVLFLAMVGFSLSQQATKSRAEQVGQNRRLATVSQNLKDARSSDPKPALRSKLEGLQQTPAPQALPSRQQALELGPAMVIYAAAQGLQLSTFETAEAAPQAAVSPPQQAARPAISYSIVARGRMDSLVGALELTGGFPTAKVQKLEFTRGPGGQPLWQMNLDVAVFHGN